MCENNCTQNTSEQEKVAQELEVETKYTVIGDNMLLCELCYALIEDVTVIFHTTNNSQHTQQSLKPTLLTVVLCDLDAETLQVVHKMSREVRILCMDAAVEAAESAVEGANTSYFAPSEFLLNVPVAPDMFSQYIADKILCAIYDNYKSHSYSVNADEAKNLLDGIRFKGMTIMAAINDMLEAGFKCFEREAEYAMVGKLCKDVIKKTIMNQINGATTIYQQTNTYKIVMGGFLAVEGGMELYSGCIGVVKFDQSGILLETYACDNSSNDTIYQLFDSLSIKTWYDNNKKYWLVPYDKFPKELLN
jgi:hypothetical protein